MDSTKTTGTCGLVVGADARGAGKPGAAQIGENRRKLARKRVLLSGVVADQNGVGATDCTIRDLTARGAQIQVPRSLQAGTDVYMIDTRNEAAHFAKVAWTKDDRVGLSFVRSYSLDLPLPPKFVFLKTLLIEAKLRQVQGLIKRGVPVEEATRLVGLDEDYLEKFDDFARSDKKANLLLHQAKRLFARR